MQLGSVSRTGTSELWRLSLPFIHPPCVLRKHGRPSCSFFRSCPASWRTAKRRTRTAEAVSRGLLRGLCAGSRRTQHRGGVPWFLDRRPILHSRGRAESGAPLNFHVRRLNPWAPTLSLAHAPTPQQGKSAQSQRARQIRPHSRLG